MQFVNGGPNIPEKLLEAHEDGRVIFFCGAGISVPAGLPLFKDLVTKIYEELYLGFEPLEQDAFKREEFDRVLDLLERRYSGGRGAVRETLVKLLTPNYRKKNSKKIHASILELSKNKSNAVRLVTTNFDQIFSKICHESKIDAKIHSAPFLPIPKKSGWSGVVHLHGILPKDLSNKFDLNRLIISSGDFGLAYLKERWASRFISELFQNYIVCFVGYGINDPILRYMMDALAADKVFGELIPDCYAFGSYSNEVEFLDNKSKWESKGVTPILYSTQNGFQDHSLLYDTFAEWAATYRDGVLGKEAIIAKYAISPPINNSLGNDFVSRVFWALSEDSGLPAQKFADLNPAPPLEWLDEFLSNRFGYHDLKRFGVTPHTQVNEELSFNLITRPPPYFLAQSMSLGLSAFEFTRWDRIAHQMARWLLRHLGDPRLIVIVSRIGGMPHPQFKLMLREKISEIQNSIQANKNQGFESEPQASPNEIPDSALITLWKLYLAGRLSPSVDQHALYLWARNFNCEGPTILVRLELRKVLSPWVELRPPFRSTVGDDQSRVGVRKISDIARCSVLLSSNHPNALIGDGFVDKKMWMESTHLFVDEFNDLLREVCDLRSLIEGIGEDNDFSYIAQPSIEDHQQNRHSEDWVFLVDCLRDAWLSLAKHNFQQAQSFICGWWLTPYPIFKRMALFGFYKFPEIINPSVVMGWFREGGEKWLWSDEVRHEFLQVLTVLHTHLNPKEVEELESLILKGPPREKYNASLSDVDFLNIKNRAIWIRLAKINASGIELGELAKKVLFELEIANPEWKFLVNGPIEFPYWLESSWDMGGDDNFGTHHVQIPNTRAELAAWLNSNSASLESNRDSWGKFCNDNFSIASSALIDLASSDIWPVDFWRNALNIWSGDNFKIEHWTDLSSIIANAPNSFYEKCGNALGWWIQSASKIEVADSKDFFEIIVRLLRLSIVENIQYDRLIQQSINHPIGNSVDALLRWWYRQGPKDNEGLDPKIKLIFSELCDKNDDHYLLSITLLAGHSVSLSRVDPDWFKATLLPKFNWKTNPIHARAVWIGFLWRPIFHHSTLTLMRNEILETSLRYGELYECAHQYAEFLAFIALESPGSAFSPRELGLATENLPSEGLKASLKGVLRAVQGSGDKVEEFWINRLKPYINMVWPKSTALTRDLPSDDWAHICIMLRNKFPDGLKAIKPWLTQVQSGFYLMEMLNQSKLATKFPSEVLELLSLIIGDNTRWMGSNFSKIMADIESANLLLSSDSRYKKLILLHRMNGSI